MELKIEHTTRIMKLIDGVYHYAAWESAVLYFKSLKTKQKIGTIERLGELLASEIHVTLAILEEDTLDWEYKLKRLITNKDVKQGSQLIDMVIEHLQHTSAAATTMQAAHRLRGAWAELRYVQSAMLRNGKHHPKEYVLQGIRSRVLDNVALLLECIKGDCIGENNH